MLVSEMISSVRGLLDETDPKGFYSDSEIITALEKGENELLLLALRMRGVNRGKSEEIIAGLITKIERYLTDSGDDTSLPKDLIEIIELRYCSNSVLSDKRVRARLFTLDEVKRGLNENYFFAPSQKSPAYRIVDNKLILYPACEDLASYELTYIRMQKRISDGFESDLTGVVHTAMVEYAFGYLLNKGGFYDVAKTIVQQVLLKMELNLK